MNHEEALQAATKQGGVPIHISDETMATLADDFEAIMGFPPSELLGKMREEVRALLADRRGGMMRDKIAEVLRHADIDDFGWPERAADEIVGLLRQYPTTETVDRYDGMTETTTDRVNRYAMVPLPEEDV